MKQFTEKDLEIKYQTDMGSSPYNSGKITHGYTRGFYDWCLDQLLIAWNKDIEKDVTQQFFLKED